MPLRFLVFCFGDFERCFGNANLWSLLCAFLSGCGLDIECLRIVLVISRIPVRRLEAVMIYVFPGILLLVIAGSCFVSKTGFGSKEARGGGR